MKKINLFYITVLVLGVGLFFILGMENRSAPLSFYGFAESEETKINYNYSVVVDQILVSPGQEVHKGDTLLNLTRRKSKETLDDYTYKIEKLRDEAHRWQTDKENELAVLSQEQSSEINKVNQEIDALEKKINFKKSLTEGLTNISSQQSSYNPLEEKLKELRSEFNQIKVLFDLKIDGKKKELEQGQNPFWQEISQIEEEQNFDENQKIIPIAVVAPGDGLIGNISCKEDEHVPSYSTLLTFYEPHSGYIRGYVHEDMTLQVEKGNRFKVYSLKNPEISYEGQVTGLGSRIIEIPTRLRKMTQVKTYGREVILSITKENEFLQKEKVGLTHISIIKKK